MNQEKKHYYLVAASIVFSHQENEVGTVTCNAMLVLNNKNITEADLGKAQQRAQMTFFRNLGDMQPPKILDVAIINLSYLGEMTTQEFHKAPEGTKKEVLQ